MTRDPRTAVRSYMQRSRAAGKVSTPAADHLPTGPIVDLPRAEDVFRGSDPTGERITWAAEPVTELDLYIGRLDPNSGERHAWEELRRMRRRVILFLEQIDAADEGDDGVAFAARFHGAELAEWLRHAEREWPKNGPGNDSDRGGPSG